MTSGMGLYMSRSSMGGYVLRLLCLLAVGVCANWIADVINHRDWIHDFPNTIFQMFFVVMLIIMAFVAEPLRAALRQRNDDPSAKPSAFSAAVGLLWAVVALLGCWYFVRAKTLPMLTGMTGSWAQYYGPIIANVPIMMVQVGGVLFLTMLAALICKPENTGLVGWFLLPFIFLPMIIMPWDQDAFPHWISLYIFGVVVTAWPLKGSDTIARCVRAYWPFLFMLLCLVTMPDMWGRCDLHPAIATWERFRFFAGELILAICFVCGGFCPDDPYKVIVWMGYWSLFAYAFHVMWFRLLGSPYGAVVTFAFIPIFYLLHRHWSRDSAPQTSASSKQFPPGTSA
jgi:hypothetical protein